MQFSPKSPVPVFPLPNLVLFPHAVVPLHVFELRYRTMVRDALSGERVIAMGLLKPGWESDYQGSPDFYPIGCLARFEEVEWLPNDCYSLVLRGLERVTFRRIVREYPYRAARVELMPQEPCSEDDPLVLSEKYALLELYRKLLPDPPPEPQPAGAEPVVARGAVTQAKPGSDLGYEELVSAVCMLVAAEPIEKLQLLGLDSIIERGRRIRELAARRPRERPAPPAGSGEHN
jgi:Lon protease-like protein